MATAQHSSTLQQRRYIKHYQQPIVKDWRSYPKDAANPHGVSRNLALGCLVTGLCAFVAGAAFNSWARTNTQLTNIANTSNAAWQVYYLNQEATEQCQKNFNSYLAPTSNSFNTNVLANLPLP